MKAYRQHIVFEVASPSPSPSASATIHGEQRQVDKRSASGLWLRGPPIPNPTVSQDRAPGKSTNVHNRARDGLKSADSCSDITYPAPHHPLVRLPPTLRRRSQQARGVGAPRYPGARSARATRAEKTTTTVQKGPPQMAPPGGAKGAGTAPPPPSPTEAALELSRSLDQPGRHGTAAAAAEGSSPLRLPQKRQKWLPVRHWRGPTGGAGSARGPCARGRTAGRRRACRPRGDRRRRGRGPTRRSTSTTRSS